VLVALALVLAGCGGSGKFPLSPDDGSAGHNGAGSAGASNSSVGPGAYGGAASVAPYAGSSSGRSASGGASSARGSAGGSSARTSSRGSSSSQRGSSSADSRSSGGAGLNGVGTRVAPAPAFVAAADRICGDYRSQAGQIQGGATTFALQEKEEPALIDAVRSALAKLRALAPPAPDRTLLGRLVEDTSSSVDAFISAQHRTHSTAVGPNQQVAQQDSEAYARSVALAKSADAAAHQLGMRVCGSPGSDWL
jgi:hypothetical protein